MTPSSISAVIWAAAGLAGVLLLPIAYVGPDADVRRYLLVAAAALVALMGVLALGMAFEAHYGHIAEVASS